MTLEVFSLEATLSILKAEGGVNLITKFINWLTPSSEIRFEFYGEDYSSEKILEGVLFFEVKGTCKEFTIKGKPAACKFLLEKLTGDHSSDGIYKILHDYKQANLIDIIKMKSESINNNTHFCGASKYHIGWASYLTDLFSKVTTHNLVFNGANYEHTRYWFFYSFEKGIKLKVHISGKPSFVMASISHLSVYGHRIISVIG